MTRIKVGLVGCGAIGTEICGAIDRDEFAGQILNLDMELRWLIDAHPERIEQLCESLRRKPELTRTDSSELTSILDQVDLIIECASQAAVREYLLPALGAGKDIMIMSVGALICDPGLFEALERLAQETGGQVYIPSGAIAGLDGLKSGAIGGIQAVQLTTRKPPRGFAGNTYVQTQGIELSALKEAQTLFIGPAREAVAHFPENVNVAASLSLAGIGPERTKVQIVADPAAQENQHEVEARGEFGQLVVRVRNVPSQSNPRTSYLAALSAIATLKRIAYPIKVGT